MMKWKIVLAALLFITMSLGTHAENLFVSLLGKSEEEVNERIEKIWEHFFTPADLSCYEAGDEKSVYYEGPDGTAFILDTGNNDVRTEGMSYGMMICVQLDHREQFDKLWKWAKRYMAFSSDSAWDGYFCWQCKSDGTKIGGAMLRTVSCILSLPYSLLLNVGTNPITVTKPTKYWQKS